MAIIPRASRESAGKKLLQTLVGKKDHTSLDCLLCFGAHCFIAEVGARGIGDANSLASIVNRKLYEESNTQP